MEKLRVSEKEGQIIDFRIIRNTSNNAIIYEKELNGAILTHCGNSDLITRLYSLKTIINIFLINRLMKSEDVGMHRLLDDIGYQDGFGIRLYKTLNNDSNEIPEIKEILDYDAILYLEKDSKKELEMFEKAMNLMAKYVAKGWKKDLDYTTEYDNIELTDEYLSTDLPPIIDIKDYRKK